MLTQQYFTRVQLAKLLGFKSVGMLQRFEKTGFLKPDVRPSKYSLNQVLFMFICKELVDFTNLSWQDLMNTDFNQFLVNNLLSYDLLIVFKYIESNVLFFQLRNERIFTKDLIEYLDVDLLDALSQLNGRENSTYENIPSLKIDNYDDRSIIFVTIDRIYRKLCNKCIELKIDLKEKVHA